MAITCRMTPPIGQGVFGHFNSRYGFVNAATLWNAIANPAFQEKYKETLVYDDEGFPTLESIMKCDDITSALGDLRIAKEFASSFRQDLPATIANAQSLMRDIQAFNKQHKDYIALLSSNNDGTQLRVEVTGNTNDSEKQAGLQNSIDYLSREFFPALSNALGINFTAEIMKDATIPRRGVDSQKHDELQSFAHKIMDIMRSKEQPVVDLSYKEASMLLNAFAGNGNIPEIIAALGAQGIGNPEYTMVQLFRQFMNPQEDYKYANLITDIPRIGRTFSMIVSKLQNVNDDDANKLSYISSKAEEALVVVEDTTNPFYNFHKATFDRMANKLKDLKERLYGVASLTHKLMTLTQNTSDSGVRDEEGNPVTERSILYNTNKHEATMVGNISTIEDLIRSVFSTTNRIVGEATHAIQQMKELSSLDTADKFKVLRNMQMTISALNRQADIINEILNDEDVERSIKYKSDEFEGTNKAGLYDKIYDAKKAMSNVLNDMQRGLYNTSKDAFIEYVKPFVGETIISFDKDGKRKEVPIDQLFEEIQDIGLWNRYLTCMSDNPNTIMQLFNKIVDDAKEAKRERVIDYCRKIKSLGFKAEQMGIKSFDKFFEDDKANYVMISQFDDNGYQMAHDQASYTKAYNEALADINKRYGNKNFKEKNDELDSWIKAHNVLRIVDGVKKWIPSPSEFPSKASTFSEEELNWYQEWLTYKSEFETMLGEDSQGILGTIKISKSMLDSLSEDGLENTLANMKEHARSVLQRTFDADDNDYTAEKTLDFNNDEIMHLGTQYQKCPKDKLPLLSTDMIGTLQAYAEMACNYDAMNDIVNPLEIGKSILMDNKTKILSATSGKEVLKYRGETEERDLLVNNPASKLIGRLNDFMSSEVYNRFINDNGRIKILNATIDKNQAASSFMKLGSACQLGFNALSWFANIATGKSMQRIEAISGQYFKYKQLVSADAEFFKNVPDFMADLGRRGKQNKISLIDEVFNVRMDESSNKRHSNFYKRNFLGKFFGPNIQFIGQDAGDAWMYNRTALAVLKHEMAEDANGNKKPLYDLMTTEWINPENHDEGKKLVFDESYIYKGYPVGSSEFKNMISKRLKYINHHLFGVYDEDSQIAARRTLIGRMFMQYRDWLPAQMQYRYGKRTHNMDLDEDTEGYYRTGYNFVNTLVHEIRHSSFNLHATWDQLDDWEKQNIYKCITEIGTYFTLAAVATFFGKANPEDKTWAKRVLRYMALREKTEHAILTPASGLQFPKEVLNIITSPMACTATAEKFQGIIEAIYIPNWFQEVESGKYKGMSEGQRGLLTSPLSLWYSTIKRTLDPSQAGKQFQ